MTLHEIADALYRHGEHDAYQSLMAYIKERASEHYIVVAGKYEDDGERNFKFISEKLYSLPHARVLASKYAGYPFCEIECHAIIS